MPRTPMSLSPGTRVGPCQITGQIGEGGMGTVYHAHDTTLKRDVAIKVLRDDVAADLERLARFQREALAALNHPNVAQIYGIEKSDDTTALVMELVDGPTLAELLAAGPLPTAEALAIALQVADALQAAHEQGIIHRDLKPANVKVRPDGTVKVLDFGLAKAMEPAAFLGGDPSNSPTITSPAMTRLGVILGTAAFMAPEQARGKTVDKRADIWAFGCVGESDEAPRQSLGTRRVSTCAPSSTPTARRSTSSPPSQPVKSASAPAANDSARAVPPGGRGASPRISQLAANSRTTSTLPRPWTALIRPARVPGGMPSQSMNPNGAARRPVTTPAAIIQ